MPTAKPLRLTSTGEAMNYAIGVDWAVTTSATVTWTDWLTTGSSSTNTTLTWASWIKADSNSATAVTSSPGVWWSQADQARDRAASDLARREMQQRAAVRAALFEEEQAKRKRAEERATELLMSVLEEHQRRSLRATGSFEVQAPSGRLYRIDRGRTGNVKVIDPQTRVWTESLCIHQREDMPNADTMLMQKLLIETAEAAFRATANITARDGSVIRGSGRLDGPRLALVA